LKPGGCRQSIAVWFKLNILFFFVKNRDVLFIELPELKKRNILKEQA